MNAMITLIFSMQGILMSCRHQDESPVIGNVVLDAKGISYLPVTISRNSEQPWRLFFGLPRGVSGKYTSPGHVSIYLRNDDALPLVININSMTGNLTIIPATTEKIFDGSIEEMFRIGSTSYDELTVLSSRQREIHATFKFVHDLKDGDLQVAVSTRFVHYGM